MDRIDTFQDLLNLLDSNPQWVEELRSRLLTPELLALPEEFARFVEAANKRFDALENDVDEIKRDVDEIKRDVGEIKGHIAPLAARRMVGKIAEVTNCRRPRWLEETEIIDIADDADTADVPPNELESFRAIDLALRAIDKSAGTQNYIVIECSYSVAANDVERARRQRGVYETVHGSHDQSRGHGQLHTGWRRPYRRASIRVLHHHHQQVGPAALKFVYGPGCGGV